MVLFSEKGLHFLGRAFFCLMLFCPDMVPSSEIVLCPSRHTLPINVESWSQLLLCWTPGHCVDSPVLTIGRAWPCTELTESFYISAGGNVVSGGWSKAVLSETLDDVRLISSEYPSCWRHICLFNCLSNTLFGLFVWMQNATWIPTYLQFKQSDKQLNWSSQWG